MPLRLALLLLAGLPPAPHAASAAKSRARSVREFGAKGDDTAKDTAAFQAALDDAGGQAGGGSVDVPPGLYRIGSVVLPAHVILNVEAGATLLGSDDPADYPLIAARRAGQMHTAHRALISADHADGIALVGAGLIQGGPTVGRDPRGPALFEPAACAGVRVAGVTVRNFGAAALHPTFCADVAVSHVTVDAQGDGVDGLDLDSCRGTLVDACAFSAGGDDIALKSGAGLEGRTVGRPCEDVEVKGCTFIAGRGGVAVGAEAAGGVRRVRVQRSAFRAGVADALLIEAAAGGNGAVEDIAAERLTVTGASVLVVHALNSDAQIRGVSVSHVKATKVGTLVDVAASPTLSLDGLTLTDLSGTCAHALTLRNVMHVQLSHITVKGYVGPRLATESVTGVGLEGALPYQDAAK